jgi:hypothetical protein
MRCYIELTTQLTDSAVINGANGYRVNFERDHLETVDAAFSPEESTRGFSALFRQFYAHDEASSFRKVHGSAYALAEGAVDNEQGSRLAALKAWGKASSRLRGRAIDLIVREKLGDEKIFPYSPLHGDDQSPDLLINAYNYGEYIHWGRNATVIESWSEDPFIRANHRYRLVSAMTGLAHLYIGFGQLLVTLVPTMRDVRPTRWNV